MSLPSVQLISLGCPKNLADGEKLLTLLSAAGFSISRDHPDIAIINTCGFIESAVEESLETISLACDQFEQVIVTGCLGKKRALIEQACPRVSAITGPAEADKVLAILQSLTGQLPNTPNCSSVLPIRLTPPHYAYLKIAEGCNHRCRFCIIPDLRGNLVSRSFPEILEEAEQAVDVGVKELMIIAQDTTAYGQDNRHQKQLWKNAFYPAEITALSRELGKLGAWIRLHYLYPYPHIDDLIALMAEGMILPYLDMPLQHSEPSILRAMGRPAQTDKMLERIQRWRLLCPDLVIRSTFIVGFPGETETEFEHLLQFLAEAEIDHAACFVYSPVEGAAANALSDHVPLAIAQEREERFMQLQTEISFQKNRERIGKTYDVLIDSIDDDIAYARSYAEAPEIDGNVCITLSPESPLRVGDRMSVCIQEADERDLFAVVCADGG